MHSYEGVYEVNLESGKKLLLVGRDEIIGENVRKHFECKSVVFENGLFFS
jgi:hypothetical protein